MRGGHQAWTYQATSLRLRARYLYLLFARHCLMLIIAAWTRLAAAARIWRTSWTLSSRTFCVAGWPLQQRRALLCFACAADAAPAGLLPYGTRVSLIAFAHVPHAARILAASNQAGSAVARNSGSIAAAWRCWRRAPPAGWPPSFLHRKRVYSQQHLQQYVQPACVTLPKRSLCAALSCAFISNSAVAG